ncbi:hypothetical protein SETIT_6G211500v2 [Setaria italica]|uniref:Uncharacterized protein n=1 Tax=Setaria italica TaxID=4555 RepID=K3YNH4_SETIT|nr:hypothetical protein SETIT_6G211500v2 [Setaria italica]
MKPRGGRGGGSEQPAARKGPWTAEEDEVLLRHVREHGPREWSSIRSKGLLPRTGKSCRLRWVNKLRPDLKTGCKFSAEEERVVLELQAQFGNKWARIATYLPGRTDNDVKNFWSTRQKRLARLLRAPMPRRRPGKQSCGASSSHAYELPAPKSPCMEMIPFQETTTTHRIGESSSSSQEPTTANQHTAAAHFPGAYGLPPPPIPLPIMHAGAERGSSGACPTTALLLPYGSGTGNPVNGVDPLVFVDPAASPEPLEVVPRGPFFGLDDAYVHAGRALHGDVGGVRFDDLPPETFDFFELPHLPAFPPPFPPPPPSPSDQL